MKKVSKINTTEAALRYSELANKYYNSDEATLSKHVADVANDYAAISNELKLTLLARCVYYFSALCQSSYDDWEKSGRPFRE
jgi:hypothetical protein